MTCATRRVGAGARGDEGRSALLFVEVTTIPNCQIPRGERGNTNAIWLARGRCVVPAAILSRAGRESARARHFDAVTRSGPRRRQPDS